MTSLTRAEITNAAPSFTRTKNTILEIPATAGTEDNVVIVDAQPSLEADLKIQVSGTGLKLDISKFVGNTLNNMEDSDLATLDGFVKADFEQLRADLGKLEQQIAKYELVELAVHEQKQKRYVKPTQQDHFAHYQATQARIRAEQAEELAALVEQGFTPRQAKSALDIALNQKRKPSRRPTRRLLAK